MPTPSLLSLLIQQTQAQIYNGALSIAASLNLPVTAWQAGDPTRSLFFIESSFLETLEEVAVGFIQAGFLDYAANPVLDANGNPVTSSSLQWLKILAQQGYNVVVPDATYATTNVTLTNLGGGVYTIDPLDLTFKNSTSGATYHNTTGGFLAGSGGTLVVSVIADESGSASSAGAAEIDTIVTGLLGVTCTNSIAAVGLDEQPAATTIAQCRNKLGSLSPNGPASAYDYVALNSALTGIQTVTRSRTYPDSEIGAVLIYVAGPGGDISSGDVAAVQSAIETWATPLCITPTVASASVVVINVTYTLWVYSSVNQTSTQIQTAVQTAIENMLAVRPIGGDIIPPATTGALYASLIEATIGDTFPTQTFRVTLTSPSTDTALTNGQVPELGTCTGTINIIPGP